MRKPVYAIATLTGVVVALLGSEPLWIPAVVALLVFPIAAAIADRRSQPGPRARSAPLGASTLTAFAGGLLAALAIRLAVDAPGWLSATAADCGGASTATQQLVLWGAALTFAVAAAPVAVTLFSIGQRLRSEPSGPVVSPPLTFYPLGVAAAGFALVAAGYVTNC